MGFADEKDLGNVEMEDHDGVKELFEDHLSIEEMILGIKEGRYF